MAKSFWSGKRVLITGVNGFIGPHLFNYLLAAGAEVIGVARSRNRIAETVVGDIIKPSTLEPIFSEAPLFACFHLAADALVEQGETRPYQTLKNNILGALNVLELGRQYKVKRLIIASTVHVYGASPTPHSEDDPPKPSRPYETSKTCVDIIAQSYADTFDLPVVIPRFVNIYGPGDLHFSRIIPKTIRSILKHEAPTMWGGSTRREYLYIDDVVRAYDRLGRIADSQIEKNRIFNFGAHQAVTVRQLIEGIVKLSGEKLEIRKVPDAREHELLVQRVNWTKAKRILGWKPEVSLPEALRRTLDWYRNYFEHSLHD